MKLSLEKKLFITFLFAIILLIGTFLLFFRSNEKFEETSRSVNHSHDVLYHLGQVQTSITDIESTSRGKILSDSLINNHVSEEQLAELDREFDTLLHLVSDNSSQVALVDTLRRLADRKNEFMINALDTLRISGFEHARSMIASGGGMLLMDSIKLILFKTEKAELDLMKQRKSEYVSSAAQASRRFLLTSIFVIVLLACSYIIVVVELRLRRNAEKKLLFESFMADNAHDAIVGTDMNFNVRFWNKAAEKIYGHKAMDAIGKPGNEVIVSEYPSNLSRKKVIDKLAKDGDWEGQITHVLPDNKKISVIISVTNIQNAEGRAIGYVSIIRNITESLEAEKKLNSMNQQLQQNVKQLQALNSDLESFTYSVSHDLRTPLRAINGYTNMLSKRVDHTDTETLRLMQVVLDNVKRMAELIDDLLNFSHVSRKELVKESTDMNTLVRECAEECKKQLHAENALIRIASLLPCYCDGNMMQYVWTNLISNAIKYSSKQSHAVIEISSEKRNGNIIYKIKDNGAGFDMKYYSKLFGVFQRLHDREEFEGTGVGLAIVDRIIAKHGGRVWAESKPGNGATFYFAVQDLTL